MDDYITPEPINRIPIKRLYDFKSCKLREVTKLPKDFELEDNEILLKVKLVAINYGRDFEWLKAISGLRLLDSYAVVPGNKFMGKIYASNDPNLEFDLDNSKFLVFPYTNCVQQGSEICRNCSSITTQFGSMSPSDQKFRPCLNLFDIGYNVDGGLQDFIKIKNSSNILIPVPENVSSHDAILAIDIVLPLYSYLKRSRFSVKDRVLMIINNANELNDLLLAIKILDIPEDNLTILDSSQISGMTEKEFDQFHCRYDLVFVFNFEVKSLQFAFNSVISTGLESTKSRYKMVLFNQHVPIDHKRWNLTEFNDKVVIEFRLNWYHKYDMVEILQEMSRLNGDEHPRQKSIQSSGSESPLSTPTKVVNHEDIANLLTLPSKKHWLYYERDIDLSNEFQKSDNSHSTRQINKYIGRNRYRICYNNRPNKSRVNALVC